jgi:predicted Zn-dependent protease
VKSESAEVNGLHAEIRIADIQLKEETIRALSYFIEKEGNVYIFHGICSPSLFESYSTSFVNTMSNFDIIRDKAAKSVRPTRLKVVEVTRAGTLRAQLDQYPESERAHEELAVLNGLEWTDQLKPGDRIKILSK